MAKSAKVIRYGNLTHRLGNSVVFKWLNRSWHTLHTLIVLPLTVAKTMWKCRYIMYATNYCDDPLRSSLVFSFIWTNQLKAEEKKIPTTLKKKRNRNVKDHYKCARKSYVHRDKHKRQFHPDGDLCFCLLSKQMHDVCKRFFLFNDFSNFNNISNQFDICFVIIMIHVFSCIKIHYITLFTNRKLNILF